MAAGEEAVDVGLGVPVFIAVAGVAEETVVAEAFQLLSLTPSRDVRALFSLTHGLALGGLLSSSLEWIMLFLSCLVAILCNDLWLPNVLFDQH